MSRTRSMGGTALALAAVGLGLMQASGAGAQAQKKSLDDKSFVKMASASDMAEIMTSKLAQQRGGSVAVKQFAAKMVADHTLASQELKALADKKGWEPAKDLLPKDKVMAQKLAQLEGADFDQEYLTGQVKAHEDAVKLFSAAAQGLTDEELKGFAEKTLPIIQHHLKMVKHMTAK